MRGGSTWWGGLPKGRTRVGGVIRHVFARGIRARCMCGSESAMPLGPSPAWTASAPKARPEEDERFPLDLVRRSAALESMGRRGGPGRRVLGLIHAIHLAGLVAVVLGLGGCAGDGESQPPSSGDPEADRRAGIRRRGG